MNNRQKKVYICRKKNAIYSTSFHKVSQTTNTIKFQFSGMISIEPNQKQDWIQISRILFKA